MFLISTLPEAGVWVELGVELVFGLVCVVLVVDGVELLLFELRFRAKTPPITIIAKTTIATKADLLIIDLHKVMAVKVCKSVYSDWKSNQ
jgi:hypothetical protein